MLDFFNSIFGHNRDCVGVLDQDLTFIYANSALVSLMSDIKNSRDIDFGVFSINDLDGSLVFKIMDTLEKGNANTIYTNKCHCSVTRFVLDCDVYVVIMFVEVGGVLKQLKCDLEYYKDLSRKDPLTGLFNRRYLKEFPLRMKDCFCYDFIFFDLDNFKNTNDMYGHSFGDKVLIGIADKCSSLISMSDELYRISGDEFVLIRKSEGDVNKLLKKMVFEISLPSPHSLTHEIHVQMVSFGVLECISTYEIRNKGIMNVIAECDFNMYLNKV